MGGQINKMRAGLVSFFRLPRYLDVALIARGVASVSVVWWHVLGYQAENPIERILTPSGRFAVWVFFALSGYLIGLSFFSGRYRFNSGSLKNYFVNRLLRVWPLFAFVTAFCLAGSLLVGAPPKLDIQFFSRELLMLQGVHAYSLNGVFWTLGVEVQFYLLLPLIVAFLLRIKRPGWTCLIFYFILAILTGTSLRESLFPWMTSDSRDLLGNLMHFQAGMLVAILKPQLHAISKLEFGNRAIWIVAFVSTVLFYLANLLYFNEPALFFSWVGALTVDFFSVLLLCVHVFVESRRIKMGPIAEALSITGVLSFGIYCWHGALLSLNFFNLEVAKLLFASTAITIVSYRLIERPLLSAKRTSGK